MTGPNPFDQDGRIVRPVAPPSDNPFAEDGSLVGENRREAGDLRVTLNAAKDATPSDYVTAFPIAQRTGVPAGAVARNLSVFNTVGVKEFDADTFVRENPATSKWLRNPDNAALAKDDVEGLSKLERIFGRWRLPSLEEFGDAFAGARQPGLVQTPGMAQREQRSALVVAGLPQREFTRVATLQSERANIALIPKSRRTPFQQARLDAIDADLSAPLSESQSTVESFARAAATILPSRLETLKGAGAGAVVGGVAGAVVGGPAGAVLGAKVGGGLGGVAQAYRLEAGNAIADFERVTDDRGVPLDAAQAYWTGSMYGVASAALEVTGLSLAVAPFARVGRRLVANATADALRNVTTRGALMAGAKAWGTAVAGETATEVAQTALQLVGERDLRVLAEREGRPVSPITGERVVEELTQTAVTTAMGMALLGIPGGGITTISELGRAQAAIDQRDKLARAVEAVASLGATGQVPSELQKIVEADIAQHDAPRQFYVPADRMTVLLQEANVTPEQFVEAVGITMQDWTEATTLSGADLTIPLAPFLSTMGTSPLATAMLDDVRLTPDGLTAREAQAVSANAEAFQQAVQEAEQSLGDVAERTDAEEVIADIERQLMNAGTYTAEQARTQASVLARPFITLADAIKKVNADSPLANPQAVYNWKGGLTIVGQRRAELVFEEALAIGKAQREGKSPAEMAALRSRLQRLADERVQVRTVLEEADQILDARDAEGRIRSNLREVSTESLALEYVRLRDMVADAEGQLAAWSSTAAIAAAEESATVEEANARLEGIASLRAMGDEADNLANLESIRREMRAIVRRYGRTVPRLSAELAARGITDVDAYMQENFVGADTSFDVAALEDVAFQPAMLSVELVERVLAAEAHDLVTSQDPALDAATVADIMVQPVSRVEWWLSEPRPEVTEDEVRRVTVLMAFRPDAVPMLYQAAFHGSPYVFDRFSLSKIGTGEGAQAYGWGLPKRDVLPASGLAATRDMPTTGNEGLSDVERRDTEQLAQTLVSDPAIVENASGFDVVTGRNVFPMVRGLLQNPQVLDAVVRLVPIDVVNVLVGQELTPQMLLDNPAVLIDLLPVNADDAVSSSVEAVGALAYGVTSAATEVALGAGNGFLATGDLEAAYSTGDFRHSASKVTETFLSRNGEPVTAQERADFLAQGTTQRPNAFYLRSERVIGLLGTANLSSFLHEMAHDYLGLLDFVASDVSAPEAVRRDFEIAMAHIGVREDEREAFRAYLRTGNAADKAQAKRFVDAEEVWARSFESYLEKGNAPSRDLTRAFATFRVWLGIVYKMFRNLLPSVSPELAGVFDRLLATEEEITEYRQYPEAKPLFEERTPQMTEAEWLEYRKGFQTRDAIGGSELAKRVLAEQRRAVSQEWKARREALREQVAEDVDAESVERAVQYLRNGVQPDGTTAEPLRLDRALLEQYGEGTWKRLPKNTTTKVGGTDADAVAALFGFRDGLSVVNALVRYEPRDVKIDRIVNETLRREFGDLLNDSTALADAATEAFHASETDEAVVRELKALARANGVEAVGKPVLTQLAREMVGRVPLRDLRPDRYRLAERREATAADQAFRRGDTKAAEFHKRRQLLNRILYREATKAVAMADKVKRFADRMAARPAQERLGKAGQAYQDAMNAVLDAYDFRRLSRPQMDRTERLRAQVAAWAEEVERTYTVETDDGPVAVVKPEVSAALLASPMNYAELSVERLQGLYDTIRQIYHTATSLDKEMRQARAMLFNERVELLVETATENWTPDAPKFIQSKGLLDKLVEDVDAKHGEMIKVEMLARLLDGDKPNGPWQEALTNYAADAQAEFNRDMEQFYARYKAAMDRIPKDRIKGFFTRLVEVPGVAGTGTSNPRITGQQVFQLLLNYGNESSRAAVNAGEFAGYRPYTDANVRKLVALLTPEEMRAAQEIWDAVSMFWDRIAELQREMTGIAPRKVQASPIVLRAADGSEVTLKGGYFPLKYDTRFSAKAYQQEIQRAEATAEGLTPFVGSARTTTEQGHLIERQDANGRIVDLSPEVVARHMTASVYDLTHRRMVYDVQKIVLDPRIADIVQRTAGVGAYRKALLPWARRLAGEKGPPQTWVAKMALRARAGASTMGLGYRFTTMALQYLGVWQTMALIGPKYTMRGFREITRYGKGAFEAADALAPAVAYRQLSFNRDLTEVARTMQAKGTWNEMYEMAFAGIAFMDRQVSVAAFWGGYYQWLDANPTDVAGAVRAGEQAIRLSQGANDAKDLAALMASNDPLTRTLTSFFSNGSVLYQLFWRANRQLKGKQARAAFLTSLLGAWLVPAVLEPLVRGRSTEDDDTLGEKVAWWVWQITTYPMQAFPITRDLARMLEPGSRFGKEFAPPFLRPFTELGKSALAIGDILGDWEVEARDVETFIRTLGYWSNLPLDAPWGMSERLYQWMTGEVQPDNVLEGGRFVLTNAPID